MDDTDKRLEVAERHIAARDTEAAICVLFELAVDCAKARDFAGAESCRNRMLEIDPMALDAIIRSGEMIDEEKKRAIDGKHRAMWSGLYNDLTMEEANALYFSMQQMSVVSNQVVYSQGELNQKLIFLDSGRLKITCSQDNTEVLITMVEPGQLVGNDTFFSSTVCTTSLIAAAPSQLRYLKPEVLAVWRKDQPVLESKLLEFASRFEKVSDILKAKTVERRSPKRVRVNGRLNVQIVNSNGKPVGSPFKVDLYDVSRGGACLLVKILKKEAARVLLGKRLKLGVFHSSAGVEVDLDRTGTVVAVQFYPFEDCSVHVRFGEAMTDAMIMDLVQLG